MLDVHIHRCSLAHFDYDGMIGMHIAESVLKHGVVYICILRQVEVVLHPSLSEEDDVREQKAEVGIKGRSQKSTPLVLGQIVG
jgi:hypothetical protein